MPNQHNIDQLKIINEKLKDAKSVILADYAGLTVAAQTELRAKVTEAGGEFTVQKNNLIKIALKDKLNDLPEIIDTALNGPTAVLYGYEDAVSATKVIVEFSKENENLGVKAGILVNDDSDDTIMSVEQITDLAKLPSRDELRGQLVGQLQAPISGFVRVLSGNISGLVHALKAIHDQKAAN